jgi:hypothetical protein
MPAGGLLWANPYGGTAWDEARCASQTFPDGGYIIAGTTSSSGAGAYDVYVMKTEPVLAGIKRDLVGGTTLMLSAGEPNPFTDRTLIRYHLGERSRVTIAVHNVLGRRVATRLDAVRDQGPHVITWDGRDSRGHALAPGIYFCSLQAKNQFATRKIVLIR